MKGKKHSTEEIIRILRQADGGETAQSVCRGLIYALRMA